MQELFENIFGFFQRKVKYPKDEKAIANPTEMRYNERKRSRQIYL